MSTAIRKAQSSTVLNNAQKSGVHGCVKPVYFMSNSGKGKTIKGSLKSNTKIPIRGSVPNPTNSSRITCIQAISSNYIQRRSLTMMEFPRRLTNTTKQKSETFVLGRSNSFQNIPRIPSHETVKSELSLAVSDNYFCQYLKETQMSETDPRIAGLKIFASIMLNAWRRRREDVHRLSEEISRLKKTTIRTKNQIYVIKSFYRVEQKRNGELRNCLKAAVEGRQKAEDMYFHSNSSLGEIQQQLVKLEKTMDLKNSEFEGMSSALKETKTEYFAALARERDLDMLLAYEQRKIVVLENTKNELIEQFHEENSKTAMEMQSLKSLVESKNNEIEKYKNMLDSLEVRLHKLKNKEVQCQEYEKQIALQREIIQELTKETTRLKLQIESTLVNRLKRLFFILPAHSIQCLHIIAYHLLPTMPAPKRFVADSPSTTFKNLKCF